MRTAARRLKPVRWVAEKVGRRASLQMAMATLAVEEVSMEGRQSVALELHSIGSNSTRNLAAQSLRKILQGGFKLNWTTKAASPAVF